MLAECHECGYLLQPFERVCPRCARAASRPPASLRTPRGQPAKRDRRLPWGIAGLVVAVAGFVAVWLSQPRAERPFGGGSVSSTGSPTASQSAPASSGSGGGAAPPGPSAEEVARREVARESPFNLAIDQPVSPKPGAGSSLSITDISIAGDTAGISSFAVGEWTLRGLSGQQLQVGFEQSGDVLAGSWSFQQYWVDQPFELLRNGQVVGSYQNTAEYLQAQQ